MAIKRIISIAFVFLIGCGSGGGSGSGTLIEGTLTQGGEAGHALIFPKHEAGELIGEVEICALEECSTTDDKGQWGVVLPESFAGGLVSFTVKGHGIDTVFSFTVPSGAKNIFLDLMREGDTVELHSSTIDGVETHSEEH